jgi:predicted secreted protein
MAATASYLGEVQVNSGGGFNALAGVNDVSISLSRNLVDVSVMNASDDFTKRLATLKDFPITISGFFEPLDTAYQSIKTAFTTPATTLTVKVIPDGTKAVGSQGFQVTALVESIEISASVDGAQEVSISLQSNSDVSFL